MSFLFIILYFHSFSYDNSDKVEENHSSIKDSTQCLDTNAISHVGFYNFTVTKECSITTLFNSGSVHMFLFLEPFNPDYFELSIDEENVNTGSIYTNGRLIKANNKATIKFTKENLDELNVNIWLLPSHFCSDLSLYAYNTYSIEMKIPYTTPQICIFSPSFDSINNKYTVNFGINSADSNHVSSIYTKSFYRPLKTGTKSEIIKTNVNEPFITDFKFNYTIEAKSINSEKSERYYENFIFYKRITNQINSEVNNQKIKIGSVSKCNSSHGCVSSFFPPLEVNVEQPKWYSNIELIPLFLCIGISIVLLIFLVFCCKKMKKKLRMRSIKNDISGLIQPNSENNDINNVNITNELNNSNLIDEYFPGKTSDIPENL